MYLRTSNIYLLFLDGAVFHAFSSTYCVLPLLFHRLGQFVIPAACALESNLSTPLHTLAEGACASRISHSLVSVTRCYILDTFPIVAAVFAPLLGYHAPALRLLYLGNLAPLIRALQAWSRHGERTPLAVIALHLDFALPGILRATVVLSHPDITKGAARSLKGSGSFTRMS